MKKIPLLALAVIVSACAKEVAPTPVASNKVHVSISAGVDAGTSTRLTLGKALKPQWSDTDSLAIFDGSDRNLFLITENKGATATFGGVVTEGASEVYAVFPYSSAQSYSNGTVTVDIPATQTVAAGDSVSLSSLLCVAHASSLDEGLSFKNVCGLIEVKIPKSGCITSVILKGNSGETLAGTGTVTVSDTPSFSSTKAETSITLLPENGTFDAGNYYFTVAPVTFSSGFSVYLIRNDGSTGVKSTKKSLSVARNSTSNLNDVTDIYWSNLIMTKEQLWAWNDNYSNWTAKDTVRLGADIDMESDPWTPHTFRGIFDGQGYKLSNIYVNSTTSANFIDVLYGQLKNVEFASGSLIHEQSTQTNTWYYVGPVGRMFGNASISNVINRASVEVGSSDNTKTCIGGIVAYSKSVGSIENCSNYGTLSNNATQATATTNVIGGIIAKFDTLATVSSCNNYGKITNANPKVQWIGGIVGVTNGYRTVYTGSTFAIKVLDCSNSGEISLSDGYSPCVGGVVGYLDGGALSGCSNSGAISSTCDTELKVGGIVGKFDLDIESSISNCTNNSGGSISVGNTSTYAYIGGIVGSSASTAASPITLTGCKNYAALSTTCARAREIGGIAGRLNGTNSKITLNDCHNYGAISNVSTSTTGDNRIAGLVAYMTGNTSHRITISSCSNEAAINSTKPAANYTGGLVGMGTYIDFADDSNSGAVSATQKTSSAASYVAGLGANLQYSTFSNCTNSGAVTATTVYNTRVGGIAGHLTGSSSFYCTVDNCTTTADATVEVTTATSGGYSNVAGFVGYGKYVKVSGSTNKSEVIASQSTGHGTAGGFGGFVEGYCSFSDCVNEADITLKQPSYVNKYYTVGGIVGRATTSNEISGCTNNGTILGSFNTANQLATAAGILGDPRGSAVVTNNINNGSVTATNASATTPNAFAGGIIGNDNESNGGADTITGNYNYGTITASTTREAKLVGAGGLFGYLVKSTASGISGNYNYGNVSATSAGETPDASIGGAGAACGVNKLTSAWSCYVSTGVTVNGTTYSSASSAGTLSTWLCPYNSGTINVEYVSQ